MVIAELSKFTVGLKIDMLSDEYRHWAQIDILDAVESCLDSIEDNKTKCALNLALQEDGVCTLIGRKEKSSVRGAILYNTVVGSVNSRNDINFEANAHPAASLVPLVLAVGQQEKATGATVLEALIVGYEIEKRLGLLINSKISNVPKSFRKTSLVIAFASAFVVSKLMNFNEELTSNAAALSCNYLAGINQWRFEGTGEDVFMNAMAAECGYYCAKMAQFGMRAALDNLEGEFGFLSIFGVSEKANMMLNGLEKPDAVILTRHKIVPACRALQSVCIAADVIASDIDVSKVKKVNIYVPTEIKSQIWYFRKTDVSNNVQAILSMPFGLSSTLVYGNHENINWAPPYSKDVNEIMDKVEVLFREGMKRDGVEIEVFFDNGSKRTSKMDDFPTFTDKQILNFFLKRISVIYGKNRAENIMNLCLSISEANDISLFVNKLSM